MGNNQELPSFVQGDNNDTSHASNLMEEFDTQHNITSSPYGSQTNGTPENTGKTAHHPSMNDVAPVHTLQTDPTTVQNQEVVSATERHTSEPAHLLASQDSGPTLQGLSIHASTSRMVPRLNAVHPAESENPHAQPAKKTGRATRRRANTESNSPEQVRNQTVAANPLRQGGMANENASIGGSLNGVGPFPMFIHHGGGNTGFEFQTGGHLADEELGEAMARGSGPGETVPNALVSRGYDFGTEGQQQGQAGVSVPKIEYQNNFHGRDWAPNPNYGPGAPDTNLTSAWGFPRPEGDRPNLELNWYGEPINDNAAPNNEFGFDPSNYGHTGVQSEYDLGHDDPPQHSQEHHGQSFGASPNMMQGESFYPDPESSQQPSFHIPRMQQPHLAYLQPGPATRSRGRRSVQRQLLPAGVPNNALLAPNNLQQASGAATGVLTGNITLRYTNLDEAERAINHVNNPVSIDTDPTMPQGPERDEQERSYVRQIVAAMHSTDAARDNQSMINMWIKQRQNAGAVEQVAWRLLRRCLVAHCQLDPLVPGGRFTRYQSFEQRLLDITNALLNEKTLCRHAMSANFHDQFVDDPLGSQHRVHNNRKVNGGKKHAIEEGRRAMAQNSDGSSPMEVVPNVTRGAVDFRAPLNDSTPLDPSAEIIASAETADPGRNARIIPRAGQTITEVDRERARARRENQAQANNLTNKKAASKKGAAAKAGTGAARKRKTDDDSDDSTYQPIAKKTNKRQSAGAAKREYKGKYPIEYNAETGETVITSLPSPTRSMPAPIQPAPIQPAPRPDHSFLPSGQYPAAPAYPATSSYGMDYHNLYQPNAAPSTYTGGATRYQSQQNAMMGVTGLGLPYGDPYGGYGSGYQDPRNQGPTYHGQYADTPERFAQTYQHLIDPNNRSRNGGNPLDQDRNPLAGSGTVEPRRTRGNPLNPSQNTLARSNTVDPRLSGDNPLNLSQPPSDIIFPHAPGNVDNEFDQDEPEPLDLSDFTSLGQRRKRQRKPRGQ
ncbi:hypothetical protein MMC30_002669 [Trapelia coarctata]|nr:hypothetical protein [Trapelia coarctata]